jgi:hypothetical protein
VLESPLARLRKLKQRTEHGQPFQATRDGDRPDAREGRTPRAGVWDGADGVPFTTEATFVTSHVIAVNPEASRAILVAVLHSQVIGGNMKGGRKGSFGVRPYAPALSKIIDACAITGEVF